MRCRNCGKRIKKNSSYCIKCGAKIPPAPPKEKKKKKGSRGKKKRSKAKILIPLLLLIILALLAFLLFGGDRVPEKIRNLKGYSQITETILEKLPNHGGLPQNLAAKLRVDIASKLPFDLPDKLELPFKLPFELPGKDKSDHENGDTKEKNESAKTKTDSDQEANSLADKAAKTEESSGDGEDKKSPDGVNDDIVISDSNLYGDNTMDWKYNNIKVLKHSTDSGSGTDKLLIYMEMENHYVNMAGTKEILYRYNKQTGKWNSDPASKLTCLSIEPKS
jgi:hypothetical protein